MGEPFWADDPELWNRLYIEDIVFDETDVQIDGAFGTNWDVQTAPGTDGPPGINKGYEPVKPKITWMLYTEEHQRSYEFLLSLVQPKPGKQAPKVSVTVVHPLLRMHKKEKFKIALIHLLKPVGGSQMQATWDLIEHFDAPKQIPKAVDTRATTRTEVALQFRDRETPSKKLLP